MSKDKASATDKKNDLEQKNKKGNISSNPANIGDFEKLLEKSDFSAPQVGDIINGSVISASRAEVKLDINGILTGVVRGPELYEEDI